MRGCGAARRPPPHAYRKEVMSGLSKQHVAVIGCGIVGVSSAIALLKAGHRVTLLEPGNPGGEQAASYGNGAWLSPASIVPMSMPGLWRKVPGYLLDPEGPLVIRLSHLPRLAPWLLRFLMAGSTVQKVERTARALSGLLGDAPRRHLALAAEAGKPDLIRQDGLLYAYPDRAAFAADALGWRLRRDNGVARRELEGEALHAFEPALSGRYQFGALVEAGGHCLDPGCYVAALARHARALGAVQMPVRAMGFVVAGGRLTAVATDEGTLPCDRAVIAAGIRSRALAAQAGDRIPLESERGYHVEIANPAVAPRIPVMPSDGKMGNTVTRNGLRAAGQVEFSSADAPPDWSRAAILLRHLLATYPGLGVEPSGVAVRRWQGNRPSTPDGLPVISPATGCRDIIHAFGHGHVGLAAGPMTGDLVASLIGGHGAPIDTAPFAAARFH